MVWFLECFKGSLNYCTQKPEYSVEVLGLVGRLFSLCAFPVANKIRLN